MRTDQTKDQEIQWDQEEMLNAYKRAAEYDDFLFGDFDYSYVWKDTETNDVY